MRRALIVITVMLLCAIGLYAKSADAAAAGPCKGSKYRSNCTVVAKRTPKASIKTTVGGSRESGSSQSAKPGPQGVQSAGELAFQRDLARYNAANRTYTRCVESGRAGCSPPGTPALLRYGAAANLLGGPSAPDAPLAPQITPAQAGAIAVARLSLPANAPSVGPDPEVNKWKMAVVGYPLWLWAEGPTHIGPVGENVGGLSVSLDANVSRTVFRMGDGNSVTCRGRGTPYTSSARPGAKSPTCGYVYEKPSLPSKKYTVTAVTYWEVTWTVNGTSGVQTVPMMASRQLPVGEVQVLRR